MTSSFSIARLATGLLLLTLALIFTSCTAASNAVPGKHDAAHADDQSSRDHDDEAHDPDEHDATGAARPLASLGTALVHKPGTHHDEGHAAHFDWEGHDEPSSPLIARGSPLVHTPGAKHMMVTYYFPWEHQAPAPPPALPSMVSPTGAGTLSARPSPSPVVSAQASPVPQSRAAYGRISGVEGTQLLVTQDSGETVRVSVAGDTTVEGDVPGTRDDLRPGLLVGVTSRPDHSALRVRVLPRAVGSPRPGVTPLSGDAQGSLFTVGELTTRSADLIAVRAVDQVFPFALTKSTEVTVRGSVSAGELTQQRRVSVFGPTGPGGMILGRTIHLLSAVEGTAK